MNDLTRYVEWEAGGHAVEGAAISLCYFFILSLFLNFFFPLISNVSDDSYCGRLHDPKIKHGYKGSTIAQRYSHKTQTPNTPNDLNNTPSPEVRDQKI